MALGPSPPAKSTKPPSRLSRYGDRKGEYVEGNLVVYVITRRNALALALCPTLTLIVQTTSNGGSDPGELGV